MYSGHFGLKELPFGLTPDTQYAFQGQAHQEALNTLLVALRGGEGFVKITGEVGTGKTLLCRKLLATLGEPFATAYVPNPHLDPRGLFIAVAEELGLAVSSQSEPYHLLKLLNIALLEYAAQDRPVVLCLDEAQAMPLETLEALRLLSNLETEKRKLLQVVLFGQPELDERLAAEGVRQIRQRIAFHYRMSGLRCTEVSAYLAYRLRVAGSPDEEVFQPDAARMIFKGSRGTPRLINILAHKAMLAAWGEGSRQVLARHVRIACRDTEGVRLPLWPLLWRWV